MDFDRLCETIAMHDAFLCTIRDNENGCAQFKIKGCNVTMFGDTLELLGYDDSRIEIPVKTIKNIEYSDEENIVITRDSGVIYLYLNKKLKNI